MRILFLESHPMLIYGLPGGFRDIGCEVKISGPLSEERISSLLVEFQPDLVFTLGWSFETTTPNGALIYKYVRSAKIPMVYWATEDPTHTHTFTLPWIRLTQPDFVFTICRERVDEYQKMGIAAAHSDFGFHPAVHFPATPKEAFRCSVGVVANGYPNILRLYPQHYRLQSMQTLISPVLQAGIPIDFWGRDWAESATALGCAVPQERIHGYLDYTMANQVYSSADILLGLQNHKTQLSQRTYEILGSGGFLITSDTDEIHRLFRPGEDLVVSKDASQTADLVQYYLKNPKERERIRQQGQKTVLEHSYANRAQAMLKTLQEKGILS